MEPWVSSLVGEEIHIKKVRSVNKIFAECLVKDRRRTVETGVMNFFIEELPCVVETRCRVPNRVGGIFWEQKMSWLKNVMDVLVLQLIRRSLLVY